MTSQQSAHLHAPDAVGHNRFALPRSADDDAPLECARSDLLGDRTDEDRVVNRIRRGGTEIGDRVSPLAKCGEETRFVRKAGVVGANRNVHVSVRGFYASSPWRKADAPRAALAADRRVVCQDGIGS